MGIDLSGPVMHFASAYTRRTPGAQTIGPDGHPVAGAEPSDTVHGLVVPMTGRDREALPEGIRANETKKFYVVEQVKTVDKAARTPAQIVEIGGEDYHVVKVEDWNPQGGFYVAFLQREVPA